MTRTNVVIVPCLLAVGGCLPAQEAGFDAPAPNKRLDAIVGAADASDEQTLSGLIGQLESTDPAARLLAIQALERRTGQTLGYQHAAPVWERRAAVDRWKKYADGLGRTELTSGSDAP
ncbi:MAG: hypothetical protein RIB60_03880 [Phycisphaerales bacterium]